MRSTGYAAVWQDGGPVMAGRILLDADALTFEGAGPGREASCRIAFATILSSHLGRSTTERVAGRPALVLELEHGELIRIATPELGALHEIEEALRERAGAESRARG